MTVDPRHAGSPVERAEALLPLVRANADAAEAARHLPAEVARAFARAGLYRIAAPESCGGEEADPATQIRTIETISRADAYLPAGSLDSDRSITCLSGPGISKTGSAGGSVRTLMATLTNSSPGFSNGARKVSNS